MTKNISFCPGATTAKDVITLPISKGIRSATSVQVFIGSDGTAAAAFAAKTLTAASWATGPATTEYAIEPVSGLTMKIGDNTTTKDIIIMTYNERGESVGF